MGQKLRLGLAMGVVCLTAWGLSPSAGSESASAFMACKAIEENDARLACYDAAAKGSPTAAPAPLQAPGASLSGDAALKAREAALAEREASLKAREAELAARSTDPEKEATFFGISLGSPGKPDEFSRSASLPNQQVERDEDGAVEAITSELSEWSKDALGRVTVVLANGQVWRQSEGDELRIAKDPEKPHVARIERGAIGSFTLKINESNRLVKVRRIDGQTKRR